MAMTRKGAREDLAALFVAAGSFTVVNAFLPLEVKGASKVLNIYTRSTRQDRSSKHNIHNLYTLNLDVLVLRLGTAADEDDLDTLNGVVEAVCVANPKAANWDHLELDSESETRYVRLEGNQYRMERHKVFLNTKPTG